MTITVTVVTGRPKRDIIQMAREFCGLAGYEFDGTPEEEASHLRKLDAMMAEWPWNTLGYNSDPPGGGTASDGSGLANSAINAVSMYLGLSIAPGLTTAIKPAAAATMARSYSLLFAQVATVPTMPRRNTPRGAGNRYFGTYSPFINETTTEVE